MKRILRFIFVITIISTLTSCDRTKSSNSEEIVYDNMIVSTTECDTELITDYASATENSSNLEITGVSPIKLPDAISDSKKVAVVSDFNYFDYLDSQYNTLSLIAIDEEYVYFEKWIEKFNGTSDLIFYKYNLTTGESTEFNGIVPGFNVKTGDTAFVNNSIYSVMYNNIEIVHYSLDTRTNVAEIIHKEDNNDSLMRTTHAVGKDSYVEIWATGQGYNQTIHVMLFDKSGSREIITKKYNSSKERLVYTANGDHIYEYAQTSDSTEPCLNIYNENGELESSVCLKEIAYELKQDPDNYVAQMNVSGRFISFDFNFGESTAKSYIYDMEIGSYYRADCCQSIATPNYLPPDFGKILFLQRNSDSEGTKFDLFCLYANGGIEKLSENIGIDTMIVANGEKVAYFKNKELYTIEY